VAHRISKTLSSSALSRVSMNLDEVLRRLEEGDEDQVLAQRVTRKAHFHADPSSGSPLSQRSVNLEGSSASPSSPFFLFREVTKRPRLERPCTPENREHTIRRMWEFEPSWSPSSPNFADCQDPSGPQPDRAVHIPCRDALMMPQPVRFIPVTNSRTVDLQVLDMQEDSQADSNCHLDGSPGRLPTISHQVLPSSGRAVRPPQDQHEFQFSPRVPAGEMASDSGSFPLSPRRLSPPSSDDSGSESGDDPPRTPGTPAAASINTVGGQYWYSADSLKLARKRLRRRRSSSVPDNSGSSGSEGVLSGHSILQLSSALREARRLQDIDHGQNLINELDQVRFTSLYALGKCSRLTRP
jgi:hypothetical protein